MRYPTVYLAGPIAGTEAGESTGWRGIAAHMLGNFHIHSRDPMRAKEKVAGKAIDNDFNKYKDNGPFYTSRGIMARDFNDVNTCDALLVNLLGARKPSIGTVMELAWAYALHKPVVVVMEATGNPHDNHPMIREAIPFCVETLDEGVHAIAVILGRA